MTSPGLVYVDETVEEYADLRLPPNWTMHLEPEWGSIAASMRYCLEQYPDASQYGWLADDNIPQTPGWDVELEQAAGDWYISCARDYWMSELGWLHSTGGPCFTAGLCWGGELIRTVGWWALPGVRQGGIDEAWNNLAGMLHLTRYLPDVIIEHRTWKLSKRNKDETDGWIKHGITYIDTDLVNYHEWCATDRNRVSQQISSELKRRHIPISKRSYV